MISKQQIRNIKVNIERTIQSLHTKPKEFIYKHTNSFVKPNTLYSVYYTLNKKEMYLTGIMDTSNSKLITRVKYETMFSKYSKIKSLSRQKYPEITPANPSESDYRIGSFIRYFVQKANNSNAKIFEISKEDFNNKNNLYRYTSFQWRISGKREEVNRDNRKVIIELEKEYSGIIKILFTLQYWKQPKNSVDSIQKKLSLLKPD